MKLDYVENQVYTVLEDIKHRFFGSHPDDPVVLHRKEIMNAQGSFRNLVDTKVRDLFNKELLELLDMWEYNVISVIMDKQELLKRYRVWHYDPYHYCLMILLERYIGFLENLESVGDVLAESRGGKEDLRLKKSFERLYNEGSGYVSAERFHKSLTSSQLKVKNKGNNISGLQIADLLAHPSRLHMIKAFKLHDIEYKDKFAADIIDVLKSKYIKRVNQVDGWGIKKLP